MAIPNRLVNALRVPVIGAPMFLISRPELVIAQCKSGVLGTFPSLNCRPKSLLREWIQQIRSECDAEKVKFPEKKIAPFGVNLVALDDNKRLDHDLAICIEEKVPVIITSMRAPQEVVRDVHAYGGVHFHDVVTRRHAEKAIEAGVDGVVLVCAGAGGHAGMLNPFAFVREVRSFYNGSIVLAGCLNHARDVLAAQVMGADLAYIGTRFIATQEANADAIYKQMIVESGTKDIVYTPHFTGVNASFLIPSIERLGIRSNRLSPPLLRRPNKLMLWWKHWRMRRVKKWKDIWSAGQGVAGIKAIMPVREYVDQLAHDYQRLKSDFFI